MLRENFGAVDCFEYVNEAKKFGGSFSFKIRKRPWGRGGEVEIAFASLQVRLWIFVHKAKQGCNVEYNKLI